MSLSHHHHTGRYLPHHHTSYLALTLVALCAGLVLVLATSNALAVQNPQSGSVALSGRVDGPPPTQGATILVPSAGQHFTTGPITVSGTCPKGLVVEIFRNDIFGGSTVCDDSSSYSLLIDLFNGSNKLVARDYDALDQHGPDSAPVTVTFALASQFGNFISQVAQPVFLLSDPIVRGISPNVGFKWNFEVVAGKSPYAINIDWGDGKTDLISQSAAGKATADHSYDQPGNYTVILKVTDAAGSRAYVQGLVVVNGTPATTKKTEPGSLLLAAWPLYGFVIGLIISFWLGEKYDARRSRRQNLTPQFPIS